MRKLISTKSEGQITVRRRFLFFPKTLPVEKKSDEMECRWLEWASWCQVACRWHAPYLQWVDEYWTEKACE